ncbi:MAG TPA: F0F1 ATP synthase subunit B [Thermoanaerobaculia bacterium]|nr:F0F1 ATP synthase subunit B [Thermoanaerobaculia bacterium]
MSEKSLRLVLLLTIGLVTPASAQEEGGLLSLSGGLMFWTIVTFVIVLTVLWKLALPPILGAVEAREQQIRDLLAAAALDREAAQQAAEDQSRQLEETRSRVQELVAEGKTAGERVREEIIAEARRQAEEIMSRARRDVRQELDRAIQELREEAVDIALLAASRLIERNLDEADNRRLVRDYLADLEGSPAPVPAGV